MLLTLTNLGFPIAVNKIQGPCTSLKFVGIMLDSARMEAHLPRDKGSHIQTFLTSFKSRKSCTFKELRVLIGTLNFACKVVPSGCPFLQPMIELTCKVSQPYHHIKLSSGFFKDLRVWQNFISSWNGASLFVSTAWINSDYLHLNTNASGSLGLGSIFGSHWFQG